MKIVIIHPSGKIQEEQDDNIFRESEDVIRRDWEDLYPDCKVSIEKD